MCVRSHAEFAVLKNLLLLVVGKPTLNPNETGETVGYEMGARHCHSPIDDIGHILLLLSLRSSFFKW